MLSEPAIKSPTVVIAVVVTHNRPELLRRCLDAVGAQLRTPDRVIVVDNASDTPASAIVARALPSATVLRLGTNDGPASGFNAGIEAALACGATHLWLMDDDGLPGDGHCLSRLLATSASTGSALSCPLVRAVAAPDRLAFPIRQAGRTRFRVADLVCTPLIHGFAHLFNGALITAETFRRIGLPMVELFIRGDEVEFLLRARRAGLRVTTDARATFLHPASDGEIHPILGGAFYAVVPGSAVKQHYQFRNRGWIFTRYRKFGWLAADHVRYALHFLRSGDADGYARWLAATWSGVFGRLDAPAPLSNGSAAALRLVGAGS